MTTKLFHVSDVHFGAEDPAALTWFAERVAEEKPDAVIMTGDLTMRARPSEFEAGGRWLRSLDVPVTLEVGNHDLPYYWDPVRRLFMPYRRYGAAEKLIERPLEIPGVSIIPLKTTARAQLRLNWSKGRVGRDALDLAAQQHGHVVQRRVVRHRVQHLVLEHFVHLGVRDVGEHEHDVLQLARGAAHRVHHDRGPERAPVACVEQ